MRNVGMLFCKKLLFMIKKGIAEQYKPSLLTPYPKGTCPFGRAHSSLLTSKESERSVMKRQGWNQRVH